MKQCNNGTIKKGFTLLEVIIAIFLVTVGMSAVLVLITKTITTMALSFSQLTAAYLTQEGIEIVRNIRDTNWIEGADWDDGLVCSPLPCQFEAEADYDDLDLTTYTHLGRYLKFDGGFYNYDSGSDTKFKRKITITPIDLEPDGINDILEVTILVLWTEKRETYSHTAQEKLYKWR